MSYRNLKAGDRIEFWQVCGLKKVGGRVVPDMVRRSAPVQRLLVFHDHVVVNLGGRYGRPQVVNESNFIRKVGE